ncbi:MAG: hypothetical protein GF388_03890 [Candidatus Aegiribacteria sp.]|nr:hypothetical protein [Candidatus Aegiribacteria sp.]MBD3294395.1 hypothetical protein [Candidatus Fermentibacteria bacterium]
MKRFLALFILILSAAVSAVTTGYNVTLDQVKDKMTLTNSLSLQQQLTSRITLNTNATFTAEKNSDLGRFIDARVGNANISFTPFRGVVLGVDLSRTISSTEIYGELTRDRLRNTTSGQIRYTPSSWFTVNIGLGSHYVDYVSPSGDSTISGHDEGGVQDVDISMNRSLFPGLSGSVSLGEHRTLGYQKDTGDDNLSVRMSYAFPRAYGGGSLEAQVRAKKLFTTYNDSNVVQRQDDWSSDLALVVPVPYENVSMEVTTGWDYSDRYYEYDDPDSTSLQGDVRDRTQRNRFVSSSLRYTIMEEVDLNMTFSRNVLRVDQKRGATGVSTLFETYYTDDDRSFSASVDYTPGESKVTFYRLIQLLKRDTFGTWTDVWGIEHTDNYDYDMLREVLSLSAKIPLSDRMEIEAVIKGQNRETLYLMAEQSANSTRSSTYSIDPSVKYDVGGNWTLQERLSLSADYTQFVFPEQSSSGSDLLFRRVSTNTSFKRTAADSTTLGITHIFRFNDQGSYDNAVFSRSEEVISNIITLDLGFHVGGRMGLTPSYSWEYQKRNYLAQPLPPRVEHIHHVGLRTIMDLQRGTLSLDVTRSFYSDENRDSYWKASVGLNYQF